MLLSNRGDNSGSGYHYSYASEPSVLSTISIPNSQRAIRFIRIII